jgi:hypothetical protein
MKHLKDMWLDHEERVIEALLEGLDILKSEERLTRLNVIITDAEDGRVIEDKINRELLFCLRRANARLLQKGRGIKSDPQYEQRGQPEEQCLNPPSADYKRVDIRWGYFDELAAINTEQQGEKCFCIECKRLGSPTSSSWKLNSNYVHHGIVRFISDVHRYGQHAQSGAMIGYLEDMASEEIFQEVNTAIEQVKQALPPQAKISLLALSQDTWQDKSTSRLSHHLERSFPKSPFTLWHFWLDLRECYPRKYIKLPD